MSKLDLSKDFGGNPVDLKAAAEHKGTRPDRVFLYIGGAVVAAWVIGSIWALVRWL